MKGTLSIFITYCMLLLACNRPSDNQPAADIRPADTVETTPKVTAPMPFPATQTDDWKMGDPEKLRTILTFYRNLVNDTLYDELASHIADTITNVNFENKTYNLTPQGFSELVHKFRSRFTKFDEEFKTYLVMHSDKLDYDQVMLWIKETGTYQDGHVDSTRYQENWRINKEGKIFYRSSYMRY